MVGGALTILHYDAAGAKVLFSLYLIIYPMLILQMNKHQLKNPGVCCLHICTNDQLNLCLFFFMQSGLSPLTSLTSWTSEEKVRTERQ